jgi:hypothetical protein
MNYCALAQISGPPPGDDKSAVGAIHRPLRWSVFAVRAVTMDSPHAHKRRKRPLDQPLGHDVPVRPVEELLLHVVVPAGMWWMWWVLIVEDELGRPALSCL